LSYLDGDPARHGVLFHGSLKAEKYGVMSRASVGLPNPTGFTECCPGSVLEMSACRLAVVAMRQWGMCDTIADGVSGFLCENDHEYVDRVISLFRNPDDALSMGAAGRKFVSRNFSHEAACVGWGSVINEVLGSQISHQPRAVIAGRYPLLKVRIANNDFKWRQLDSAINFVDRLRGIFLKKY
jgi:glycosyltransferase involved in cell wall biosynthesis